MELSIQDLGSLGELIGAVAVVVTLIYLSSQIKQNTVAVKAAAMQSVFVATSEVWRNWTADFDRTEKFFEIASKTDRIPAERQFHLGFVMQTIRAQENMFFHLKLGTVDSDFVRLDRRLTAIFSHPQSIYRTAWDDGILENYISVDFLKYVNNLIAKLDNTITAGEQTESESST